MGDYNTARTYQFRAKLSRSGYQALDDRLAAHCRLYNAALEERRTAWQYHRVKMNLAAQKRELTGVRSDDPEWANEHRRLAVGTLERIHNAFEGFFRRVKAGQNPGYPRFKSRRRFRTLDIYSGVNNFLKVAGDKGSVVIKGLPTLRIDLRRELPEGQPQQIRITRKPRSVIVSLVYGQHDPEPSDTPPVKPVGIDRGVVNLAALSDGEMVAGRRVDLRKEQRLARRVSRAKKGSAGWRKKAGALARHRSRETTAYRGFQHELSARLVERYDFFAVEALKITNMVKTAAGTLENPGKNVAQKRGLNRSILQQAWGRLVDMIAYKAASAGKRLVKVNPAGTSITCSACGVVDAKSRRNQADFVCRHCGYVGNADVNAAMVILRRGLDACESDGTFTGAYRNMSTEPGASDRYGGDVGVYAEIRACIERGLLPYGQLALPFAS